MHPFERRRTETKHPGEMILEATSSQEVDQPVVNPRAKATDKGVLSTRPESRNHIHPCPGRLDKTRQFFGWELKICIDESHDLAPGLVRSEFDGGGLSGATGETQELQACVSVSQLAHKPRAAVGGAVINKQKFKA